MIARCIVSQIRLWDFENYLQDPTKHNLNTRSRLCVCVRCPAPCLCAAEATWCPVNPTGHPFRAGWPFPWKRKRTRSKCGIIAHRRAALPSEVQVIAPLHVSLFFDFPRSGPVFSRERRCRSSDTDNSPKYTRAQSPGHVCFVPADKLWSTHCAHTGFFLFGLWQSCFLLGF